MYSNKTEKRRVNELRKRSNRTRDMFKSWYSNFYNQFAKLNHQQQSTMPSNGDANKSSKQSHQQQNGTKLGNEYVSHEKISLSSPRVHVRPKGSASPQLQQSIGKNSIRISPNSTPSIAKLTRSPSSVTPKTSAPTQPSVTSLPSPILLPNATAANTSNLHRNKSALSKSNSLSPKKISSRKFIHTNTNNTNGVDSKCVNSSFGVATTNNSTAASSITSPNRHVDSSNSNAELNTNLFFNTFQSLVHYGDNIGAKIVKCLINENLYESQSLINQDYDIYQVISTLLFIFQFTILFKT